MGGADASHSEAATAKRYMCFSKQAEMFESLASCFAFRCSAALNSPQQESAVADMRHAAKASVLATVTIHGVGLGAGVSDSRSVVCSSVLWAFALLAVFLDL